MALPIANVRVWEERVDTDFLTYVFNGETWELKDTGKQLEGKDENGNRQIVKVDPDGNQQVEQILAYLAAFDAHKVVSAGQTYLDLVPDDMVMALNTAQTIGSGENYDLSLTGGWIQHPDIARAKAIQFWGQMSQTTEVKLYLSPDSVSDSNTPEFVNRSNGTTEYMFQDVAGGAFTPNYPSCSRIIPISANALKLYLKTTTGGANTIQKMRLRLFF